MTKGKRRKIMSMILDAFEARTYFKHSEGAFPAVPPKTETFPSVYVFPMPEDMDPLTNEEYSGRLRFMCVGFVRSNEDLELEKMDLRDEIEETLQGLMQDDDFITTAVMITLERADPTPMVLRDFGYPLEVMPPYGAVRIDCEVLFDYET